MSDPTPLGMIHRFEPATDPGEARTLLLLHGTGGNEDDLLPLGRMIAPTAALLSPRGQVLEHGMPRFFRRLAEGVFDLDDLRARTHQLAEFVTRAATHYGFDRRHLHAIGFSNGANIAASLLLLHPELLAGAALIRPMVPFEPELEVRLDGHSILVAAGQHDPIVRMDQSERLATILKGAGANVTLHWSEGGHGIERSDLDAIAEWWAAAR